jgi:hypothetical protein
VVTLISQQARSLIVCKFAFGNPTVILWNHLHVMLGGSCELYIACKITIYLADKKIINSKL